MGEKLTKSDVAKIEEEINYRKLVVRKNAIEAVKEARAQGDLSENFEYYAAKKDKNQNESRIRYLERMLKNAQIVSDESKDDEVGINNTVELYMEDDDEVETYRLVTSIRGNSLEGLISIESPLGKAIFKHKAGDRVYVKVIDYKTGNTSFDMLALYHGLQLQLMIYLDGALKVEQRKYPEREIVPAGIFYYNVKDPMIQEKIHADVERVQDQVMKKLKMNGLVQADDDVSIKIDETLASIPVSRNKDGSFSRRSSVASRQQFNALGEYVRRKICDIRESILDGNAAVAPYELGKKNACTYCPYITVCGFDRKIPGYEFHRLPSFSESDLWKKIMKEDE